MCLPGAGDGEDLEEEKAPTKIQTQPVEPGKVPQAALLCGPRPGLSFFRHRDAGGGVLRARDHPGGELREQGEDRQDVGASGGFPGQETGH